MDEFSRSRFRLEARYHHVLVDEFQDTSRLQWQLVALLVQSWGEGVGLGHEAPLPPSLFIVGDRKQSIYRFRDADVDAARRGRRVDRAGCGRTAAGAAGDLAQFSRPSRPAGVRQRRAAGEVAAPASRARCVPLRRPTIASRCRAGHGRRRGARAAARPGRRRGRRGVRGSAWPRRSRACSATARRPRPRHRRRRAGARPGDIAILFRSRESHREFERALDGAGIPTYVYKGLGFFDADEIKDLGRARPLAGGAGVGPACGGVPAIAVRRLSDDGAARASAPDLGALALTACEPPAHGSRARRRRSARAGARARRVAGLAGAGRSPAAGRSCSTTSSASSAYALRAARPRAGAGPRERQEVPRRSCAASRIAATRRWRASPPHRPPVGGRRVERRPRCGRRGQPDDGARVEGARVPDRVPRQPRPRRGAAAAADPRARRSRRRRAATARSSSTLPVRADTLEPGVEREETKRLLYVAVTRARERLYPVRVAQGRRAQKPVRSSLGSVLPASWVTALFGRTAGVAGGAQLAWGGQVRTHQLRGGVVWTAWRRRLCRGYRWRRHACRIDAHSRAGAHAPRADDQHEVAVIQPTRGSRRVVAARGRERARCRRRRAAGAAEDGDEGPLGWSGAWCTGARWRASRRATPADEAIVHATADALVTDEERTLRCPALRRRHRPGGRCCTSRLIVAPRRSVALFAGGTAAFEVPGVPRPGRPRPAGAPFAPPPAAALTARWSSSRSRPGRPASRSTRRQLQADPRRRSRPSGLEIRATRDVSLHSVAPRYWCRAFTLRRACSIQLASLNVRAPGAD